MAEWAKTEQARRETAKLKKLRDRKVNRWRLKHKIDGDDIAEYAPAYYFFGAIAAAVSALLGLFWGPLWDYPIKIIIALLAMPPILSILLGIERGSRNLYEWATIRRSTKKIEKYRKDGSLFEVTDALVNDWKNVVRQAGGDPDHESVTPEKYTGVFQMLVELEQMRNHKLTTRDKRMEIQRVMNTLISDSVTPTVQQVNARNEEEVELHNYHVEQVLEHIKTWQKNFPQ